MGKTFDELVLKEIDVSRETFELLEVYHQLLVHWNPKINLVSPASINDFWHRHIYDSLQLSGFITKAATKIVDIGSGGGFPGLPIAIALREKAVDITLIDSDKRKCEFLRTVARKTDIKISVIAGRIEEVAPLQADVITARALAPLPDLLSFAHRHLKKDGTALFLKGDRALNEIEQARKIWSFNVDRHASKTQPSASILVVGDISDD